VREVVVAVGQRSTFIRTVPVPGAAREEIAKMVAFKIGPMLPLGAGEYVSGFRLGREANGDGRVAVVGAIRTGSLRRIHQEATENGLRVRAVLPLAFGSWMAARAKSLNDCAVVETRPESIHIDVVANGELRYSRTVPLSDTGQSVEDEIAKTLAIADVAPTTVLSMARPDVVADYLDPREALEHLADPNAIDRLLFTLELPEKALAKAARAQSRIATRAIATAAVAVLLGAYVYYTRYAADAKIAAEETRHEGLITRARTANKVAATRLAKVGAAKTLLDRAFLPAQGFADVVTVIASAATENAWFTGLTLERGKAMVINGQATNSDAVTKYVKALAAQARFRDVKLEHATKGMIGDKPIIQFAISGHVVGNLPLDETVLPEPSTAAAGKGGKS
jgi:Tfp pilus assembly protein PilN